MSVPVKIIAIILFGDTALLSIAVMLLYIAGLWRVLEKSGIKGWWALIPGARDYQLARCAGREPEGRLYSVTGVAMIILQLLMMQIEIADGVEVETTSSQALVMLVLTMVVIFVRWIYSIRVFSGLIEVYNVRRRWMWLFLTNYTRWIPMLVWGFGKKYQPEWKVEDIKAELKRLATHGSASVMDEGLTVNLRERSATEFFQK